jgi:serine/threonine protein kinase
MAESMPSIPGYEILGELGRGGMGIVYKAQDLKEDRLVAVKLILIGRGANPIELARFRIEAEAIGSLHHPNMMGSRGIEVHLGFPFLYLSMPRVEALPRESAHNPCQATGAAHVCLNLGLAMRHAHE